MQNPRTIKHVRQMKVLAEQMLAALQLPGAIEIHDDEYGLSWMMNGEPFYGITRCSVKVFPRADRQRYVEGWRVFSWKPVSHYGSVDYEEENRARVLDESTAVEEMFGQYFRHDVVLPAMSKITSQNVSNPT